MLAKTTARAMRDLYIASAATTRICFEVVQRRYVQCLTDAREKDQRDNQ
jgi:hypothetical protein